MRRLSLKSTLFGVDPKSECAGVYKNKKNGYQTGLNEIRFKLCQTPRASLLRPQTRNCKKHKPKKAASEVETAF